MTAYKDFFKDYECAECNPTIFNKDFKGKCLNCINLPYNKTFYKTSACGVSEINSIKKGGLNV